MKFPYGVNDFYKLITRGEYYVDRTDRIPLLEETGDALDAVQAEFAAARNQAQSYRAGLKAKYGDKLKLRCFAVVAVGFERILWEEIK